MIGVAYIYLNLASQPISTEEKEEYSEICKAKKSFLRTGILSRFKAND